MLFFQDKACFIQRRYRALCDECHLRNINIANVTLDPEQHYARIPSELRKNYQPTVEALQINRERIAMKIASMPDWYTRHGRLVVGDGCVTFEE